MLTYIRIGTRLSIGFGILLLFLLGSSLVALRRMDAMAERQNLIMNRYIVQDRLVNQMDYQAQVSQRIIRTVTILGSLKQDFQAEEDRYQQGKETYDTASRKLQGILVSDEAKRLFSKIIDNRDKSRVVNEKILDVARFGDAKQALAMMMADGRIANDAWSGSMSEMKDFLEKQIADNYQLAQDEHRGARNSMIILGAISLLLGSLMAWLIQRSVAKPLAHFRKMLDTIASGDLQVNAEVAGRDELAEMGEALNAMTVRLREAILSIQESAFTIAQASSEIAAGNADLSGRTEEQASSLEETASSLEEFTSTIKQTADNTRVAAEAASSARGVADAGRTAVQELLHTMDEINASSTRIAEIISVVDEISFQTNLLALNAAVEAARAGEQGRGFAVVASEVRSLARRSAESAKEIKALVRDSDQKTQEGHRAAVNTGEVIHKIANDVKQVSDIISNIATATREQSLGVSEINKAVVQMEEVTQQNAALVEEAAAAAENLDDQARNLAEIAARFRTGKELQLRETRRDRLAPQSPRTVQRKPAPALRSRSISPGELVPTKPPATVPPEEDGLWESF